MGTRNCLICDTQYEMEDWTEDSTCPGCGQKYAFDEGMIIQLSDEQWALLRAAANSIEGE